MEIFYEAIKHKKYTCFLSENTVLPMMFMCDAIRGTIDMMEAESDKISVRSSYNMSSISFSPKELSDEINKHIQEFTISYQPDFRQQIADSWPQTIDDSVARNDWGWKHEYSLNAMTDVMLREIEKKLSL